MSVFFKGWRRKTGFLTLLMASLFMVGWVRSTLRLDFITSCCSRSSYGIESVHGMVKFARRTPATRGRFLSYGSTDVGETQLDENGVQKPFNPWEYLDVEWRSDWLGFHFGAGKNTAGTIRRIEFWIIPYWSVTVPLTLLSAYLLVVKNRSLKSKNDDSLSAGVVEATTTHTEKS